MGTTLPLFDPQETHFATVGNRQIAKHQYTTEALYEHLLGHVTEKDARKQWCTVQCACHAFGLRATEENRKLTRERLHRAATQFLDRGLVLLKIRPKGGELRSVKFYDSASEPDRQLASKQYELAVLRGEESAERLHTMARIIGAEPPIGEAPPEAQAS
jgi:hypothetical protein